MNPEDISLSQIESFLEEGKEEDLHLDFKGTNGSELRHRDDKKNYAQALSAFANSDGGILIWGIDARKNDEGIDCATDDKPLEDVKRFMGRLNELESDAVLPVIDGVGRVTQTGPPKQLVWMG